MADRQGICRALVVGIDHYPRFGDSHRLFGAVADARAIAETLVCREFPEPEVSLLVDHQAGREAILEAMDSLAARCSQNDYVVFYFSGHGSQMTDREGDEGDGLDETLVPADSGRELDANRDITDDEVHLWARRILEKGSNLALIFDCCHAGTLHRPRGFRCRAVPPDLRPPALLPPSPVPGPRRDVRTGPEPVRISACGASEQAWELPPDMAGGQARGAFTFHWLSALNATQNAPWNQLVQEVAGSLRDLHLDQVPEGSGLGFDGPVFGRPVARQRQVSNRSLGRKLQEIGFGIPNGWQVQVLRRRLGPWQQLSPDKLRFVNGDHVQFRIRRECPDEPRSLFLYVVDRGLTETTDLIFPDLHDHELLDRDLTLRIGARPERPLELYLPEAFGQNGGNGSFVFIATPKRVLTSALLQSRFDDGRETVCFALSYYLSP